MQSTSAAFYIRVSTEEQAKFGFSIEAQLKELRQYCSSNKINVFREYIDAGVSTRSIRGRRELERLLEHAKQGKFQKVVVWRLSRLSRNLMDVLNITNQLQRYGIELHSLTEQLQTGTPLGDFFLQLMGAASQFELEQISETVRLGMLARSKQGKWNSGNNVIGYRLVHDGDSGESRVEVVPEEAELVKLIFELYASGKYGLKAITNRLNHLGYVTKKGHLFYINAVRGIVQNQNYVGMIRYNVTESKRTKGAVQIAWAKGQHEPIVSPELWKRVCSVYEGRSKKPTRTLARRFPLTGLLKCPQCGSGMIAGHNKGYRKDGSYRINYYYVCGNFNSKGSAACRGNHVRADDVEQWFFSQLQRLINTPAIVDRIATAMNTMHENDTQPLRERLLEVDAELKKLDNRQQQSFQAFEAGDLPHDQLVDALNDIKGLRQKLLIDKEDLENRWQSPSSEKAPSDKIKAALQQVRRMLNSRSPVQQKELLSLLVEKITIPPDKNLTGAAIHGSAALIHMQITETMEGK